MKYVIEQFMKIVAVMYRLTVSKVYTELICDSIILINVLSTVLAIAVL